MTERHSEDRWDTLSRRLLADIEPYDEHPDDADDETGYEDEVGARRHVLSRVNGWSLLLAATSSLFLLLLILVTGTSVIGLAAFGAIGVMSWVLVIAEILSVRRL